MCELIAPGIAVVRDLDELLRMPCDGIVIATPSALHAQQALAALDAGKAVFCQKPLGRNAAEVRRVVAAARENNVLLGVDLSYRFLAGAQAIKTLVQNGAIGDIFAVNAVFHNAYGPDKPWFYDRALSGGGCVIDLGIHLIDLVLWLLDFPRVTNVCSKLFSGGMPLERDAPNVEEYAFAHADLGGRTHLSLDCSWRLSAGRNAEIRVSFYGSGGGLSIQNVDGSFYDFVAERFRGTAREILHASPDEWGGRAAVAWAHRLSEANTFDGENERLIDVAETLDAIYLN
jgi:predicted dehydrogenase